MRNAGECPRCVCLRLFSATKVPYYAGDYTSSKELISEEKPLSFSNTADVPFPQTFARGLKQSSLAHYASRRQFAIGGLDLSRVRGQ